MFSRSKGRATGSQELGNNPAESETSYKGPSGARRVLVVDDEDIMRVLLGEALSGEFALSMAASGEEALSGLMKDPPDVMVVDKNLPGISGLHVLQQVKALNAEIEIIVITGYASLESSVEALRMGAFDYLIKPFDDINIVTEKVRRAAEKKEMNAERRVLMDNLLKANQELRAAQERLRAGYLQTLTSMITALEARDAYTRGHSDRVAAYTAMIGKEMGLEGDSFQNLLDGALLHDVGKIGIRESVLNKQGKLTDEEYRHIQTHPDVGAEIIGKMEAYQHLVSMIRHHHERFDGKGYPGKLKEDRIPLEARIIAVADTFDAMTSERPYRKPRTHAEALRIIREVAGTQLDPKVSGVFLMIQGKLDTIPAASP
jgi:putative nucleotidyltransferase with HDIG domain